MPQSFIIPLGEHGHVSVAETPDDFPLGVRGARPVTIHLKQEAFELLYDNILVPYEDTNIGLISHRPKVPGAHVSGSRSSGGNIQCAWDVAYSVAKCYLGSIGKPILDAYAKLAGAQVPLRGLQRYQELGVKEKRRDYQQVGALFLLRRSYAILGDAPRAGKCFMVYIVSLLRAARKTLIICTRMGKRGWASDAWLWMQEEAVLLSGKSGTEARIFCGSCQGSRRAGNAPCKACVGLHGQPLGYKLHLVRDLERVTEARVWYDPPKAAVLARYEEALRSTREKNEAKRHAWLAEEEQKRMEREVRATEGKKPLKRLEPSDEPRYLLEPEAPKGVRRSEQVPVVPTLYRCTLHPEETDTAPRRCSRCQASFDAVIEAARVVIVNYDLLPPHKEKDLQGGLVVRQDIPGLVPLIRKYQWDIAALDEAHRVRGFATKMSAEETNRRECVIEAIEQVPQVFAVTGTPSCGFTRDYWGILDIISGGLYS
jgi:hypothetical protein